MLTVGQEGSPLIEINGSNITTVVFAANGEYGQARAPRASLGSNVTLEREWVVYVRIPDWLPCGVVGGGCAAARSGAC